MSKVKTMEQFKKTINLVEPGNYDLKFDEMELLIEMSSKDLWHSVYDAYKFGFLKGSRSAKAEQKKTLTQELIETAKEA